jgi:uncharacterized protein (TIGR02996 family)
MLAATAEEAGFWSAIAAAPHDEGVRRVFADWLEDRDDPRGPLFRERHYWSHLGPDGRDAVQVVLGILDACPTHPSKGLIQAADLQEKNPHLADLLPGVLTCLKHEDDKVRQTALKALLGCKRRSAEGARLVEAMIWQERDRQTRRDAGAGGA